jgi:hypothetical protein
MIHLYDEHQPISFHIPKNSGTRGGQTDRIPPGALKKKAKSEAKRLRAGGVSKPCIIKLTSSLDSTRMATLKQRILQEAARRFEEQQQHQPEATCLLAPISPSPQSLIEEALRLLAQEKLIGSETPLVTSRCEFIDLGCGDGRWLLAASKQFANEKIRCIGYDLDQVLLDKASSAFASHNAESADADAAQRADFQFHRQDLMTADVSGATVIVAYLFREGCVLLQEKLERELPPASAVISVGFSLKLWEPKWALRVKGCVPLYFYVHPWRVPVHPDGQDSRTQKFKV